jgi:hypothetical protein
MVGLNHQGLGLIFDAAKTLSLASTTATGTPGRDEFW